MKSGGNKAAIARQKRQRVIQSPHQGAGASRSAPRSVLNETSNLRRQLATCFRHFIQKRRRQLRRCLHGQRNGLSVARAAALHGQTIEGARHIGRGF